MDNIINLCKIGLHYDVSKRYNIEFFLNNFISILRKYKETPGLLYSPDIIKATPNSEEYDKSLSKTKKSFINHDV